MVKYDAKLDEIVNDIRTDSSHLEDYYETVKSRFDSIEPKIQSFVPEKDRWRRLQDELNEKETDDSNADFLPPLYGVPIAVKDIFHADGLKTRAGSDVPPETLTGQEADVVSIAKKNGALVLGKSVTAEFAYFEPGPTRNPHNLEHTPGGSSSGSAAAVAAGLCPLAFGTQTIGSISRPAAFCGIVGFKPSYGRIPTDGVIPCAPSVDHVGLFTQSTPGIKLAAQLFCKNWRPLPTPKNSPTLGVPKGEYLKQADESALEVFRKKIEMLEKSGYNIKKMGVFDNIEDINQRHKQIVAGEFALTHEDWYEKHPNGYAETSVELLEQGRSISVGTLAEARAGRAKLRSRLESRMDTEDIDLWITPSAVGSAPAGIDSTGDPIMNLPWTHAGLPTISIPAGKIDGLPLGVQCIGRFNADEDLISWSHDLSDALV